MTLIDVRSIDYGDAGVLQTLRVMAQLVNNAVNEPTVVQFARRLAVVAGPRMYVQQALGIRQWLSHVWRFVDDPPDRELLRSPAELLNEYQQFGTVSGDCDEVAILGAALGKSIGFNVELIAIGFFQPDGTPGRYEHVYAIITTPTGATVDMDVTRPALVPPIARHIAIDV